MLKHDGKMLNHVEIWFMFILVSTVYHDGVWQLEKQLSYCVHVTFQNKQNDMSKWMDVINQKMQGLDWKPNAFIVDDVDAKINSLR